MKIVLMVLTLVCMALVRIPAHVRHACLPPNVVAPRWVAFQTGDGKMVHWNRSVVTYSFDANVPDFAKNSVASSFNQWAQALNGLMSFKQVAAGDISVIWDLDGTKIVNPVYLAYTDDLLDNDGTIILSKIVINANKYDFHSGIPRGVAPTDSKLSVDIDGVSLHEIGHALGLNHSDLNPSGIVGPPNDIPTMNSILFPGAEKLHQDDIAGILAIYSGVEFKNPTEFSDIEQALDRAGVKHANGLPKRIAKQVLGKATKAITMGTTTLYFDNDGKYIGQTANRRFISR